MHKQTKTAIFERRYLFLQTTILGIHSPKFPGTFFRHIMGLGPSAHLLEWPACLKTYVQGSYFWVGLHGWHVEITPILMEEIW